MHIDKEKFTSVLHCKHWFLFLCCAAEFTIDDQTGTSFRPLFLSFFLPNASKTSIALCFFHCTSFGITRHEQQKNQQNLIDMGSLSHIIFNSIFHHENMVPGVFSVYFFVSSEQSGIYNKKFCPWGRGASCWPYELKNAPLCSLYIFFGSGREWSS